MTFRSFPKGETRATAKAREKRQLVARRRLCRAVVVERAQGRCERCRVAISDRRPRWHPQRAHMNHKVPLSRGGQDTPENCELICQGCHLPGGRHAPTVERVRRV